MSKTRTELGWFLAAGLVACSVLSGEAHAADAEGEIRKAIDQQRADYVKAYNTGDIASWIAVFADDIALSRFPLDLHARGRKELEKLAGYELKFYRRLSLTPRDFRVSADSAYESGDYAISRRNDGEPSSGTYSLLWTKQADGSWKVRM